MVEMMRKADYLIIGQGLAGTLLAWFLLERGKSVYIVDQTFPGASSPVAAGIFNPITGRRFVKTWLADEIFPFAEQTYRTLEMVTGAKFYHPKRIIRQIATAAERQEWERKASRPEYETYLKSEQQNELPRDVEILGGGNLDVGEFIRRMATYFRERELLEDGMVDHRQVSIGNERVVWRGTEARRMIFCEGYRVLKNPWFGKLPFTHAKGELLTIHAPGLQQEHILNRGIFILPLGGDRYKVGATYDWDDLSAETTINAREEIIEKLKKILDIKYEVIDHEAGIRPTVKDRRPTLGIHPDYPQLGLFNGLGTKGVSLGPYFAHHFTEHLVEGIPLIDAVDIKRFDLR